MHHFFFWGLKKTKHVLRINKHSAFPISWLANTSTRLFCRLHRLTKDIWKRDGSRVSLGPSPELVTAQSQINPYGVYNTCYYTLGAQYNECLEGWAKSQQLGCRVLLKAGKSSKSSFSPPKSKSNSIFLGSGVYTLLYTCLHAHELQDGSLLVDLGFRY